MRESEIELTANIFEGLPHHLKKSHYENPYPTPWTTPPPGGLGGPRSEDTQDMICIRFGKKITTGPIHKIFIGSQYWAGNRRGG